MAAASLCLEWSWENLPSPSKAAEATCISCKDFPGSFNASSNKAPRSRSGSASFWKYSFRQQYGVQVTFNIEQPAKISVREH